MKHSLFILGLALSMTAFSFAQYGPSGQPIPQGWGQAAQQHSTPGTGQSSSSSMKQGGPITHSTHPIHPTTPASQHAPVKPMSGF